MLSKNVSGFGIEGEGVVSLASIIPFTAKFLLHAVEPG